MRVPHHGGYATIILVISILLALFARSCASRTSQLKGGSLLDYHDAGPVGAADAAVHSSSSSSRDSSNPRFLPSTSCNLRRRALRQSINCDHCAPNACALSGSTGTFKCSSCLNGYKPNRFTGACECPAGYYPSGSGSSGSCAACPLGSYCPGTAAEPIGSGIHACPDGMTTMTTRSTSQSSCVNAPGYFWTDSDTAQLCPTGSFSPGLKRQRTCNSCPSGYTTQAAVSTSSTACALSPGWYMTGPGSVARCPYGKYKEGYGTASSCTSCPTGVTTDGPGKASATECKYLLPGYEASNVTGTQITAAAACRINSYCPGTTTPGDQGYVNCPNQRWTVNISSTSVNQCMVPPGHSASGTNVTKCPSGYYKAAWTLTDTADCTPCGSGIDTEDGLEIKRYRQDGRPSASVFVAGGSASCYIPRGYEMIYSWDSASSSYTFAGRPCTSSNQICAVGMMDDGNLYSNRCSGYGVIDTAYGLKVRPCKWCQGPVSKIADLDLGFSVCSECMTGLFSGASGFCEIPPGKAVADSLGVIFMSPPSNTSLIKTVLSCPANYYCPGGPSHLTVPTACTLLGSPAGSASSNACNQVSPGKATADASGTVFTSPPSNVSLVKQVVSCPANYYCSGGLANVTVPTACSLLGSLAGALSSADCNQIPPGKAAADTGGTVFTTAPSDLSLIKSLVSCPANYYCPGGQATAVVPTACGLLNSLAGASSADGCNIIPPGKASADSIGTVFTTAPSDVSLIKSLVLCPASYYCPGGTATSTTPTACPLLTSLAGASSSAACNLVPAGKAAANATTVFSTTVSSISSITQLVLCPQGFYCPGGDPAAVVPTPCNSYINTAGTGSAQQSDCNLAAPGYRLASTNTAEECASGYYTSGWTNASSCSPCGNGLNWVSTQTYSVTVYIRSGNTRTNQTVSVRGDLSICLGPPGYYYDSLTNALIGCPDGTYKSTYDRATSCLSCGATTSTSPRTSSSSCGAVSMVVGSAYSIFTSSGLLSTWTSSANTNAGYSSVSLDQSGRYAVVARATASTSGHIYFSSDAGATWAQISTTSRTWVGVAINNAGNMVVAVAANDAQVWQATTGNGGTSWTWSSITGSTGQGPWTSVAISGTGYKIIAAASSSASSKKLWIGTSSDGTIYTWANGLSGGSALVSSGSWTSVSVADDGSYMAVTQATGNMYVSYDSGATFTTLSGSGYPGSDSYYGVACNKNCTQLLVAKAGLLSLLNGQIYKAVYSGGTWTWTQPLSTLLGNWREVASSADGQTLVAGSQNVNLLGLTLGAVYVSTNGGSSWNQASINTGSLLSGDWTGIAINA